MRWRYNELKSAVTATELGVSRALVAAFGGKAPEDMPDYEDAVQGPKRKARDRIPAWMKKFEEVNAGRVIQTG